jgi:hypothetical protein
MANPSREPPSSSIASSRTLTLGGRVQRDVRLQAALALLVGIAVVAVPLFIWGRNRKPAGGAASASASTSVEEAGVPQVSFGDAGAQVSVDAGGRGIQFSEPRYLRCQDPGPAKTLPEKCDHVGPIEELVTKAIAERGAACIPPLASAQTVSFVVDVSFKRKKMKMKDGKEGSTMPAATRKRLVACLEKGLTAPNWETLAHAHQRYVFQFLSTFGPSMSAPPPAPPPAPGSPAAPPAAPGPTLPP